MTYNDNPKSCGFSDLLFEEFYKGKVLCQSRSTLCRVEEMQHLGLKDSSSDQRTSWSWLSQSMPSWIMTTHCHFFNYHGDDTDLTMTRSKPTFETSSTGNVSPDNKKILTSLHNFCKSQRSSKTSQVSASTHHIMSFHIWLWRNDPMLVTPAYLPAPCQPNSLCELRWHSIFSCVSTGATLVCSVSVSVISFVLFSTSSLGTWLLHF